MVLNASIFVLCFFRTVMFLKFQGLFFLRKRIVSFSVDQVLQLHWVVHGRYGSHSGLL